MEETTQLTAPEYLDRFFDELREEVRSNPVLASRLVRALGGNVVFDCAQRTEITNPFAMVVEGSKAKFYAFYSALKLAELRKVLKEHNLASSVDVQGMVAADLVDMLYERATAKVDERTSSS